MYILCIIYIYTFSITLQPNPNDRAFQLGRPKPLRKIEPSRLRGPKSQGSNESLGSFLLSLMHIDHSTNAEDRLIKFDKSIICMKLSSVKSTKNNYICMMTVSIWIYLV